MVLERPHNELRNLGQILPTLETNDIWLLFKRRLYNAAVRNISLQGCEDRPLAVEESGLLSAFDPRCRQNIV